MPSVARVLARRQRGCHAVQKRRLAHRWAASWLGSDLEPPTERVEWDPRRCASARAEARGSVVSDGLSQSHRPGGTVAGEASGVVLYGPRFACVTWPPFGALNRKGRAATHYRKVLRP